MTEIKWLYGRYSLAMLDFLEGRTSSRKLWLFGCACCRQIWHQLDAPCKRAVETCEQYLEGEAHYGHWLEAVAPITPGMPGGGWCARKPGVFGPTNDQAQYAVYMATQAYSWDVAFETARVFSTLVSWEAQCLLVRDIFGNPYRPAKLDAACLTTTVLSVAQAIYADYRFDLLPILADALEEAGCTDEAILAHCRSGGEHVRGCWLVDAILGKG